MVSLDFVEERSEGIASSLVSECKMRTRSNSSILSLIKEFERRGPAKGQAFWQQMLDVMGMACETPPDQLAHVQKDVRPRQSQGQSGPRMGYERGSGRMGLLRGGLCGRSQGPV